MPFMERCRESYGDVFTLRIASEETWVLLADPDAVKQVFTGDPRLLHAGEANVILRPLLGHNSVLLLDEQPHMTQRKLMLPSFHGERMQRYGELMTRVADEAIDRWPLDEPIKLWPRMQAITLEVIIRAVFGVTEGERLERFRQLLRGLLEQSTAPPTMLLMSLLGPARVERLSIRDRILAPVHEAVVGEIRARRADPDITERDDILSLLVQARDEDGAAMSDEELRDELLTLLVAGHETTATALAWALELLLHAPPQLARLKASVAAGERDYLDAVIKETLRLRPVLPVVVRRLVESMEIGGHLLPAGVNVAPCIHLIHRRPDVYPQPDVFRPERFLEAPAGTYTWIPFGGGIRRCLGASFALFEMQQVLAAVIARTELEPASSEAERVARRAITLTPSKGAAAIIRARHSRDGDPALAVSSASIVGVS
jgi:cytochrome P450